MWEKCRIGTKTEFCDPRTSSSSTQHEETSDAVAFGPITHNASDIGQFVMPDSPVGTQDATGKAAIPSRTNTERGHRKRNRGRLYGHAEFASRTREDHDDDDGWRGQSSASGSTEKTTLCEKIEANLVRLDLRRTQGVATSKRRGVREPIVASDGGPARPVPFFVLVGSKIKEPATGAKLPKQRHYLERQQKQQHHAITTTRGQSVEVL
jgi:hypothetical protein